MILVPKNFGTKFKLERVNVTGSRYIIHFFCLALEARFYNEVVKCLLVDPETLVQFSAMTSCNSFAL